MPNVWTHGFKRGWEHNRELVGGEFPAEQGDFKFDDDTSYTELECKNGDMKWMDLARGGQRIMFTDRRERGNPIRYILQDPPSNKFVLLKSAGRQNPDTGAAIGTTSHSSGGVVGPEPEKPKPEPKPEKGFVLLSDYANKSVIGEGKQADLDAFFRARDYLYNGHQDLTLVYDKPGIYLFDPFDLFPISLTSWAREKTTLLHRPGRPGALFSNFATIAEITIDGNAATQDFTGQREIAMRHRNQKVLRVILKNFRFLGIGAYGGQEGGEIIDTNIHGASPGGVFNATPRGNTSFMCLHTESNESPLGESRGLTMIGGLVTGAGLNGAFLKGRNDVLKNVEFTNNHHALNPEGFGGGQVCYAGLNGRGENLKIHDPAPHGSGLELDGDGQKMSGAKIYNHPEGNGVTFQRGKHDFTGGDVHHNRVGAQITNEDRGSYIPDREKQFHDNYDDDVFVG